MSTRSQFQTYIMFVHLLLLTACAGTRHDVKLHYPPIKPEEFKTELYNCEAIDHRLRQIDSLRWSMREDGIELETSFQQMVQLSLASAAALAIAVPMISIGYPDPNLIFLPYAGAFTEPDLLKRTDALLIALLAKREELHCPPHSECVIQNKHGDTLTSLRSVRQQIESKKINESDGIEELTDILDNLCPVYDPDLNRLSPADSRVDIWTSSQGQAAAELYIRHSSRMPEPRRQRKFSMITSTDLDRTVSLTNRS